MIGRFSQLGVYHELLRSRDFLRIAVAGLLALLSYLLSIGGDPGSHAVSSVLAAASVALNGVPIVWSALRGLVQRRVNVDELVSLAIVASVLQGDFLSAAVVSFVMVFGSLIEQVTSQSARKAVEALIGLAPETATVLRGSGFVEVPVEQVRVNERVAIRPGDRVPVDGSVAKGTTWIDESSMTGEPMPVEKSAGDQVFAGTLNHGGAIEITVTKVGADTTLGKVIELVSRAEAHRPRAVRVIDRYARWFTPVILAAAGVAWALTGQLDRVIAVLIVGCPCALILAAPTAVVATIGRAARAGVLVKGGAHLETIGRVNAILFDKTGTLTAGKPSLEEIATAEGLDRAHVLACAASVEQHSTHPLAAAVLAAARDAGIVAVPAEQMSAEVGLGVRGSVDGRCIEVGSQQLVAAGAVLPASLAPRLAAFNERGATPLLVFEDHRPIGVLGVTDQVRPGAREVVAALRSLGIARIGLVSGDHVKAARRVADAVGIDDCWGDLAPDAKPALVKALQAEGLAVLFVGDGINDAPALATSDVGIAMGAVGSDVALETADIALMRDDLGEIPLLIHLGRRMLRVIRWNVAFGLGFNALAVLASGAGYLTPIAGAIVHNFGSILVVISSATMAFVKNGDRGSAGER